MTIAKLKAAVCACVLACPIPLAATTVIVSVSQDGIVVSSDSKIVFNEIAGSDKAPPSEGSTRKFMVVQDRIVVASLGDADIQSETIHYNFLKWMNDLQGGLPKGISVDDLTSTIKTESAKAFAGWEEALDSGAIQRHGPGDICPILVQYLIIGYQDGAPRIQLVQFYNDWNTNKLVGPEQFLIHGGTSRPGMQPFGVKEAITNILNPGSYAYKRAMAQDPQAFGHLLSGQASLDETIALTRTLIKIEEEVNPNDVGGDVQTVRVLPDGRAYRLAPQDEISPKTGAEKSAKR